jgi:osmotically-inducible protein OsmY
MAHNGEVDLYGEVDSELERKRAVEVAARTPGVIVVGDFLKTETASQKSHVADKSDWEIAQDIRHELFWSPFVATADVTVAVDDGVATLTGTVDTWSERQQAKDNALEGGAVAVINRLKVRNGPEYFKPAA